MIFIPESPDRSLLGCPDKPADDTRWLCSCARRLKCLSRKRGQSSMISE